MVIEKAEYFKDFWNYLEVLLFGIFMWATVRDIMIDVPDDMLRIQLTMTALLSLVKAIYLIRVFK